MSGHEHIREIRVNPIVPSESVLVATARGMRPKQEEARPLRDQRAHVAECPFCAGNEDKTPPEVARRGDSKGWHIRIVENLYPVLGTDRDQGNFNFGLQQAIAGYGRHEVIVDHVNHGLALHEFSQQHLTELLLTYQQRTREIYDSDSRLRYVLVFKNYGPAAGASIKHTHSQIIATPVVPENVFWEAEHSRRYYARQGSCIFCTLIDEALTFEATLYDRQSGEVRRRIDVGQYVVERGKRFVAIKPFASRYEWEVHILPLHHQADFLQMQADDAEDFARVLRRTMARLDAVLGGAQYNFFLHSVPHGEDFRDCQSSYHWHLEICPRTSIPTGFELGSGFFVNTVSPEAAAEKLRAANIDELTDIQPPNSHAAQGAQQA